MHGPVPQQPAFSRRRRRRVCVQRGRTRVNHAASPVSRRDPLARPSSAATRVHLIRQRARRQAEPGGRAAVRARAGVQGVPPCPYAALVLCAEFAGGHGARSRPSCEAHDFAFAETRWISKCTSAICVMNCKNDFERPLPSPPKLRLRSRKNGFPPAVPPQGTRRGPTGAPAWLIEFRTAGAGCRPPD